MATDILCMQAISTVTAVSYTHLDVDKRQQCVCSQTDIIMLNASANSPLIKQTE